MEVELEITIKDGRLIKEKNRMTSQVDSKFKALPHLLSKLLLGVDLKKSYLKLVKLIFRSALRSVGIKLS